MYADTDSIHLIVAPFVGAWIETIFLWNSDCKAWSLPSWERGLKLDTFEKVLPDMTVAPFVGAWIETDLEMRIMEDIVRRSLRGSVD